MGWAELPHSWAARSDIHAASVPSNICRKAREKDECSQRSGYANIFGQKSKKLGNGGQIQDLGIMKGDQFLPNVSIDELGALYKKERNAKAGGRLPAHVARRDGGSAQAVARSLYRAPGTIYGWPAGRGNGRAGQAVRRQEAGAPRRPAAGQLVGPRKDPMAGPQRRGLGSGMWTGKLVAGHVRRKYRVEYVPRTMQTLLHEMGFRHIEPGPRHPKAASEGENGV